MARRFKFDSKRKTAAMVLVIGTLIYVLLFIDRLYADWTRLVVSLVSPSVSGLALLIGLANYVLIGGEAGRWFKSILLTIAIIFGIGIIMGLKY